MNLIRPSFEILTDNVGEIEVLQLLEKVVRTCYKSEDKITPDGESAKRLVKLLLSRNHEAMLEFYDITVKFTCDRGCCYSEDTKVLTENGFKLFSELNFNDKIYTLDELNNLILINYSKLICKDYEGDLYSFVNKTIDLSVTPNHNMWVFDKNKGKLNQQWKFIKAEDMSNKSYVFNKSNVFFEGNNLKKIKIPSVTVQKGFYEKEYPELEYDSALFLKLLGMWITDGSLSLKTKSSGYRLSISQTKQQGCKYIEKILNDLKISYNKQQKNYIINNPQITSWIKENFIKNNDAKKTYYVSIPKFLKSLSKENLDALLEGVLMGDGCKLQKGGHELTTASLGFAEDLVELCLKCGKTANIRIRENKENNKGFKQTQDLYIVSIYKREQYEHLYKRKKHENLYEKTFYKGKVWCVELPEYHKLFVLRNGKGVWCGNSHELVRHRIGSFAQESTRYVNYSVDGKSKGCTFIIPQWISDEQIDLVQKMNEKNYMQIETATFDWYHAMGTCEQAYNSLLREGWKPEQARSVLPNSTKTEINVKFNLRSMRNFLNLRCSSAAHPQMRELTLPLLKELHQRIPLIFDDIWEKYKF